MVTGQKKVEEFPVRAWRVEVTQKHINDGVCGNPKRCAVAQAISEIEGMEDVDVRLSVPQGSFRVQRAVAYFNWQGKTYAVALPPEVARFIAAFDKAEQVKPFVFEMSLEFAIRFDESLHPGGFSL
jgi:hypothetical protein